MEKRIKDFLAYCSGIDFGAIYLSGDKSDFYQGMNDQVVSLCNDLPESTKMDALLFCMGYLGASIEEGMNFFKKYYVPSWSIVYWLIRSEESDCRLGDGNINDARIGHSMAMLLHLLDDHLNDRQLSTTHLTLLIRSESWRKMHGAFGRLADEIPEGKRILESLINEYYTEMTDGTRIESLESYCDRFRKQMATWLVVPVILAKRIGIGEERIHSIEAAYRSFGIAWRLLDDIADIETDMKRSVHSSIYVCLPEEIQRLVDGNGAKDKGESSRDLETVFDCVLKNGIVDQLVEKIVVELEFAAAVADENNLDGMGDEFRHLLLPLKSETHHQ